ncbi:hypothetical protein RND81_02G172400 [Saponaria officinalis]|uniref:CCHC-type domain-containing protein n=1 Tax=Saponaria officinalis TaxID=3572 RepID=A0AAW1MVC0_SAPOF
MAEPSGNNARQNAEDLARMRRLEDAVITLANNANQAGGQQQQQQQQTIFDKFVRHHPSAYDGVCNLIVLEALIREMEKVFIATLCPEDHKVGIAFYYLQREADNWWSISRVAIQDQHGFGWGRFCETLKKRFYLDELRWQKEREFLRLEQGSLSVQAYAEKFMELSRFATTIVPDAASRVRRFEKNLTPKVRTVLAGSPSVTFQQAYDRALSVYESVKAEEAETERRSPNLAGCHKPYHPGKNFNGTPIVCFSCKEPGHKSNACPKKLTGTVRSTGSGSGSGSQAQKGRIFVMTRAEAESHSGVISGIFLLKLYLSVISFVPSFLCNT